MLAPPALPRSQALADAIAEPFRFLRESTWARRRHDPRVSDFAFGHAHEMPLPDLVDTLRDWVTPLNKDWFSYKMSEQQAREAVAESLRQATAIAFDPADVAMTTGGFGAVSTALKAVADPGDEVIVNQPGWFYYRALTAEAGLSCVPVRIDMETFDLDLEAIAGAITPRTRAILVNTPHNPTGRIYPAATLRRLADLLSEASRANGRTIYLVSDEVYRRLVFDERRSHSPAEFYPHTLVGYGYAKTLLAPGLRLGYLAATPGIDERLALRERVFAVQVATGWAFPSALLQHAVPDLEELSISLPHLQRKRDRMVRTLRMSGYEVLVPEATYFLLAKSPLADDEAFVELLAEQDVLVLPGRVFQMPGYFRITLTASDATIERSLPGFAAAWERARERTTG